MQEKTSGADPGYFIVSTFSVADEAALYDQIKERHIRRDQVLVPENDAALVMLMKLTLERLGIADVAEVSP